MKQWRSGTVKSLKKAGNLNRQKGTCMKCYDMEALDAEMSFFSAKRRLKVICKRWEKSQFD